MIIICATIPAEARGTDVYEEWYQFRAWITFESNIKDVWGSVNRSVIALEDEAWLSILQMKFPNLLFTM